MRPFVLAAGVLLVSCVVSSLCFAAEERTATGDARLFGVLQTDPARAESNYKAGVRLSVLSVAWSRYQPEQVGFNEAYIAELKETVAAFRKAGQSLILELGLQYPPGWVRDLPNGRFVNQFGDAYNEDGNPGANGVNAIFNQAMRDRQAAYVKDVISHLGTDLYAVRLGWGFYGELNFPSRSFNGKENCYWAFDDLAQGRHPGLPPGISPCPVPGWKPGKPSPNHASAKQFADWYMDCLKNYHDWQIATVREVYPGSLQMMYPSWGVRPGQLDAAISHDLDGSTPAEKNGETQRGFDFARFIAGVKDPEVVVYTTWIDSNPTFGDDAVADPLRWSPVHFLADCASRNPLKLKVGGENTGRGDLKAMQLSFQRMRDYNLTSLIWAFENDLYDTSGKYATIDEYARLIAQEREAK